MATPVKFGSFLWLLLVPTVVCSKFSTVGLRGALEDHHVAGTATNFARRTPMKVAVFCAVVTSIITYCLYKVYIDSMLRRRELDEDELEEEIPKKPSKKVSTPSKKESTEESEKAKVEKKKTERTPAESSCCYDGLLRLSRGAPSRNTEKEPPKVEPPKKPNFSGTWNCVKAEGDLDGLYAAMGLGYFARCAMERAQWGAGHLSRSYEHQGEHVRLVQRATEETTQEFDITGIPQKVSQGDGVVIQTTCWDEREEGVLVLETKDLLGNNPNSWTTSRQYLKGDELIIEVSGARGHQAIWTYERSS